MWRATRDPFIPTAVTSALVCTLLGMHGEPFRLGFGVSERTVSRRMRRLKDPVKARRQPPISRQGAAPTRGMLMGMAKEGFRHRGRGTRYMVSRPEIRHLGGASIRSAAQP